MKMFTKQKNSLRETKKGFTLIEVLVSVSLFTVVAITGITAVIVGKSSYEKNQAIKSTTDSLMFILDDISRTARLGALYNCIPTGAPSITLDAGSEVPQDGFNCEGLSYEPFWNMTSGDPGDQIVYVFAYTQALGDEGGTDGLVGALYTRSISAQSPGLLMLDDPSNFQRLTPYNLDVDLTKSGFDVVGAESPTSQPLVIIRINGTIRERDQETSIALQTTVSQRAIRFE